MPVIFPIGVYWISPLLLLPAESRRLLEIFINMVSIRETDILPNTL
jgi:hypothetical protein